MTKYYIVYTQDSSGYSYWQAYKKFLWLWIPILGTISLGSIQGCKTKLEEVLKNPIEKHVVATVEM